MKEEDWNPWQMKIVNPRDSLVDRFQSWDSAASKPRLKAWNRAKQWLCEIIRLPFTPTTGHGLRALDKDEAFLYLTEEMAKGINFTDFLKSCMNPPTSTQESGTLEASPTGEASSSTSIVLDLTDSNHKEIEN